MGCTSDREKWMPIEDIISSSCEMLGLQDKKASVITKVLHRYSIIFHLSKQQLSEAIKELKLPLTEQCFAVYNLFLENTHECKFIRKENLESEYEMIEARLYSLKKLSALGIMLSNSNLADKSKEFFYTYDIDASNNLSKWEVKLMVDDILEIALNIIPEAAKIINHGRSSEINKYKAALKVMRTNFLEYFKYLILEDSQRDINCDQFVEYTMKKDVELLFDHSKLRLLIIHNYEKCKRLGSKVRSEDQLILNKKKNTRGGLNNRKLRKAKEERKNKEGNENGTSRLEEFEEAEKNEVDKDIKENQISTEVLDSRLEKKKKKKNDKRKLKKKLNKIKNKAPL